MRPSECFAPESFSKALSSSIYMKTKKKMNEITKNDESKVFFFSKAFFSLISLYILGLKGHRVIGGDIKHDNYAKM